MTMTNTNTSNIHTNTNTNTSTTTETRQAKLVAPTLPIAAASFVSWARGRQAGAGAQFWLRTNGVNTNDAAAKVMI